MNLAISRLKLGFLNSFSYSQESVVWKNGELKWKDKVLHVCLSTTLMEKADLLIYDFG